MAHIKNRTSVSRYIIGLEPKLKSVLKGAAKAGAEVFYNEAKSICASEVVRDNLILKSKTDDEKTLSRVTINVKGPQKYWPQSVAGWLEYGTSPHFISVAKEQSQGLGIQKINARVKEAGGNGAMVINGNFVSGTIFHPGARPNPFFRPTLDRKRSEAAKAAQNYINSKVSKKGISLVRMEGES